MSQTTLPRRQRMLSIDPACVYCRLPLDVETATLDHVVPRSRGGPQRDSNLVLSCHRCNGSKGNFTVREWLAVLRHGTKDERALARRVERYVPKRLTLMQCWSEVPALLFA